MRFFFKRNRELALSDSIFEAKNADPERTQGCTFQPSRVKHDTYLHRISLLACLCFGFIFWLKNRLSIYCQLNCHRLDIKTYTDHQFDKLCFEFGVELVYDDDHLLGVCFFNAHAGMEAKNLLSSRLRVSMSVL